MGIYPFPPELSSVAERVNTVIRLMIMNYTRDPVDICSEIVCFVMAANSRSSSREALPIFSTPLNAKKHLSNMCNMNVLRLELSQNCLYNIS